MKTKRITKSVLKLLNILLLLVCCYSSYQLIEFWRFVFNHNLFEQIPFPTKELVVLSGLSILVILLWVLHGVLATALDEK